MDKTDRKHLSEETVRLLKDGGYATGDKYVSLDNDMKKASRNAQIPDLSTMISLPNKVKWDEVTNMRIEVTGESSLAATRRLCNADGSDPLCLVFASARNPGGGWRKGRTGQEEFIVRRTALSTLQSKNLWMYADAKHTKPPFYSDYMLIGSGVSVFRDDDGMLLTTPFKAAFVTAAAVNMGCARGDKQKKMGRKVMQDRIARMLALAIDHKHKKLVLGAWGCGVFRNDPKDIAKDFATLLCEGGKFATAFEHVVFALGSKNDPNYKTFRNIFAKTVSR